MKAVHIDSGKVYRVDDIMSGQIKLTSAKTGARRTVSHEQFEKYFVLRDNEEVEVSDICTPKKETVEAKKRASEVLSELADENTAPAPKRTRTRKPKDPQPKDKPQEKVVESTVNLKKLCSDNGINPAKARRVLRKHEIPKPYEWSGTELERIIKLLK